jgi:ubiquinone/menaquinone biosynthesis C-methylase UbiE
VIEQSFLSRVHTATKRDYLARVVNVDKAAVAEVAARFDREYWDGNRDFGYGGYHYDGRWKPVAEAIVSHYGIRSGHRVLDVGCGKGFLLYELKKILGKLEVHGLDISRYALQTAKPEIREHLIEGHARSLPFDSDYFDLVISVNTLHNLYVQDLWSALSEIERVGKGASKYLCVESYRNEREKVNLLYWQLTCRAFHTPAEWKWTFESTGYSGDYEFIYFT